MKSTANWKTSLAGILGALLIAFGPNVGARLTGNTQAPPITSGNYLPALGLAAIGLLSKDGDVTGGTRQQ